MSQGSRNSNPTHRSLIRQAVLERDKERCTNCMRSKEQVETIDSDHNVPEGVGGSSRLSNFSTLCRQCHDAKHGNGIAPTVELQTTGQMDQYEFTLFKHFLKQILPAVARSFNVQLTPKYKLDGRHVWHLPVGDIKRLDKILSDEDPEYNSLQAADYMQ